MPWTYQRAAKARSPAAKPCIGVGRRRAAGRVKTPAAESGPRKRTSSSPSAAAAARRRSQVTAAAERSESSSGTTMAGSVVPEPGSAARATATWPAKGTSGSRPPPAPGRRAEPDRPLTSRITGVSVFWASLVLRDALVTARHVAAATAAKPMKAASVTAAAKPASPAPTPRPKPLGRNRRRTTAVSAIDTALTRSVAKATVHTARNLPVTISPRAAGAIRRVSIVPRSFSPAIASIAG